MTLFINDLSALIKCKYNCNEIYNIIHCVTVSWNLYGLIRCYKHYTEENS